jgi:energy-coupling factor transport system permease protein
MRRKGLMVSRLGSVTLGQYYPAESPIHKLDPRIKIILTFGLILALFVIGNFTGFLGITIFLGIAIYLGKLPWRWALRGLRPIFYVLIFTLLAHFFFTAGQSLADIGPLSITREGFINGLFICSRLLLLVVGTSLLTLTTSPIELTDGIEYLLSPLKIVKLPAHEIAMMMTIALRFIPTLMVEADRIMKAQMARGADFESGNLIKRVKSYLPLLIPLFVMAFRRADELALAMESRCYHGGENRTKLRELRIKQSDLVSLFVVAMILVGVVVIGRW